MNVNEKAEKGPVNDRIGEGRKPRYEVPEVRVMTEAEVLSAFQVTAAGVTSWWAM